MRKYSVFYHFYILISLTLVGLIWGIESNGVTPHYLYHFDLPMLSALKQHYPVFQHVAKMDQLGFIFTILGAVCGGYCSDRFGRKKCLVFASYAAFVTTLFAFCSTNVSLMVLFASFICFFNGMLLVNAICYIVEIAPSNSRGRWIVASKFFAALGIILAYMAYYKIHQYHQNPLHLRLVFLLAYSGALAMLVTFLPESPRWLAINGKKPLAEDVYQRVNKQCVINKELPYILTNKLLKDITWYGVFKNKKMFNVLIVIMIITAFIMLSEIDCIIRYSPYMILTSGIEIALSPWQLSIFCVLVYAAGVIISFFLVDSIGRRRLVTFSVFGMILSYLILNIMISMTLGEKQNIYFDILRPMVLLFFFSMGSTAILYLILCEFFTTPVRGKCVGIVLAVLVLMSLLTRTTFAFLVHLISFSGIYWVSTFFALIYLAIYNELLPETKDSIIDKINLR